MSNGSDSKDPRKGVHVKSEYNVFARAWGPSFLWAALLLLVVYSTIVTLVIPDGWRIFFYPSVMFLLYGLARWFSRK